MKKLILTASLLTAVFAPLGQAALIITELAPWGSGNSPYASDWFELTNTGAVSLTISGWKMDDNSNSFASAVALTGITSIAAGESVIFTEIAATPSFRSTWFGVNPPAGLQIGNYTGAGVGLSTTADAINIYNAAGTLQANVTFTNADAVSPYQTFDNAAGLNNTAVTLFSVSGTNGAFVATNDTAEVGSPGVVPEPSTYAMLGLAGTFGVICILRRRSAC